MSEESDGYSNLATIARSPVKTELQKNSSENKKGFWAFIVALFFGWFS